MTGAASAGRLGTERTPEPCLKRDSIVRLPLGFAGGLFDADTGLTRFVWRDYAAATGRFTALDPLRDKGGDTDWYGYCVDDPVNRVDVWGLEEDRIFPERTEGPEYNDCIEDAQRWNRQCKQAVDLGSFILGEKWPVRGYGAGKVGEWACDKWKDYSRERCEEQYGKQKPSQAND